jgi:outer membrane receptor protein involved in Fe transport
MPTLPRSLRAFTSGLLLLSTVLFASAGGAQTQEPPGSIAGRVADATGAPAEDVTVTLFAPGFPPREARTDAQGGFALKDVPPGRYEVRFTKPGFDEAVREVVVAAGQEARADASLEAMAAVPPEPELGDDVEEFVVIASPVAEILAASRMDADELINTLGAAEFDKLAIGDVAEALKYVAGVNVVEGQFAVIRGLEDRYSSTLYNGAPVPSPDPDRQSVQLDLFPSDIVSDLVVAKTFGSDLPSNSSGGSINIITHEYPEELTLKLSGGTGFTSNAWDEFLELEGGSPVGEESDGFDTLESDYGALLGGRTDWLEREVRFKAIVNNEVDYETAEGVQHAREPKRCRNTSFQPCLPGDTPNRAGDLALGELSLSNGKFDLTESERAEQLTGYLGFGFDLDEAGDHKLDASAFYTDNETEIVQRKENGFIPGFDYSVLAGLPPGEAIAPFFDDFATFTSWIARTVRDEPTDGAARGPLWFSSFAESKSFDIERDLQLYQLNGDHNIEAIEGLHVGWAANHAKTTQDEEALGFRYFFEPDDPLQTPPTEFPVHDDDLGPGQFATNGGIVASSNSIEEDQNFARLDASYERELTDALTVELNTGGWFERADRDVTSTFLESPTVGGNGQFAVFGGTPQELGGNVFDALDRQADGSLSFTRVATNESNREIDAWSVGLKGTLYEDLDLLGGLRLERILIESINDPFTGDLRFGAPATFPEAYLFFDRLDNQARGECFPCAAGRVFNDQLLGIKVPIDPVTGLVDLLDEQSIRALTDGEIDETKVLPTLGFTYRPLEGMAVRGAWSQTVARPSFREMGFYVSVEPGTDDLTVGNPQLQLSEVESYDGRVEYTWGEFGDLAALSLFYKTIDDPIESIVIRNPLNFEVSSGALYRTFFNNPNEATLLGVELEGRKSFGFVGYEWANYFSVGGNFTYIDAEVDRTDAEIQRAQGFFGVPPGQNARYNGLEKTRRLFGQPEWIANADVSFDHPDWGSKVTLVLFAISDVLDAAGSAFITPDGRSRDYVLDRYVDSFYQVDLILSQELFEGFVVKASVKNLTDSKRAIIYDPEQTREEISERRFRIGQDYSFSVTYTYEF